MFLDVKGAIKIRKSGYEINTVKDDIIEDLRSARAKVTITESGEINWKSSYFVWPWEGSARVIHMLRGKFHLTSTLEGGIEAAYYISLRFWQVAYLFYIPVFLLLHFVTPMPIEWVFILLGPLALMYTIHYWWVKSWLKGFIRRHIHSLD